MTIASIFMSFFAGGGVTDTFSPVSLAQAKAHLRVDSADEDALIGALIDAAAMAIETETGIICKARNVTVRHQGFADRLPLYYLPINSIASVSYIDTDGATQTLANDQWRLRFFAGNPVINPAVNFTWPATDTCDGAVSITMNAGHASTPAIDARVKQAALLLIGHWFANREAVGDLQEAPMAVRYLLSGLRRALVA